MSIFKTLWQTLFDNDNYLLCDRRYASAMKPLLHVILVLFLASHIFVRRLTPNIGEPFEHTAPHQTQIFIKMQTLKLEKFWVKESMFPVGLEPMYPL